MVAKIVHAAGRAHLHPFIIVSCVEDLIDLLGWDALHQVSILTRSELRLVIRHITHQKVPVVLKSKLVGLITDTVS